MTQTTKKSQLSFLFRSNLVDDDTIKSKIKIRCYAIVALSKTTIKTFNECCPTNVKVAMFCLAMYTSSED